ncbi:MAG TPA: substrate-binding domain-containing protein, partial [Candidatus Baltobacteraceae bacterium]|nr:substrate-binding domain-containing protein [Candidatus Baltobacteraceae bacterium]
MVSRHAFLISAGATFAMPGVASAAESIGVLYAGSLVTIMERRVVPALAKQGLDVRGEGKGSAALANLIRAGLRSPDVFISADAKILDGMIGASGGNFVSWYLNFATTRLVIGYAAASPFAHDFVLANRGEKKLTSALLAPGLRLGRTDPALDPKGYRTILACELLEAQLGPPGFAARLLGDPRNPAQIVPEETLLARLEGG